MARFKRKSKRKLFLVALPRDREQIKYIREKLVELGFMATPLTFNTLARTDHMSAQEIFVLKQRIQALANERNIYREALKGIKQSKELLARGSKTWVSAESALKEGKLMRYEEHNIPVDL